MTWILVGALALAVLAYLDPGPDPACRECGGTGEIHPGPEMVWDCGCRAPSKSVQP
jgi:hypothetical protein